MLGEWAEKVTLGGQIFTLGDLDSDKNFAEKIGKSFVKKVQCTSNPERKDQFITITYFVECNFVN